MTKPKKKAAASEPTTEQLMAAIDVLKFYSEDPIILLGTIRLIETRRAELQKALKAVMPVTLEPYVGRPFGTNLQLRSIKSAPKDGSIVVACDGGNPGCIFLMAWGSIINHDGKRRTGWFDCSPCGTLGDEPIGDNIHWWFGTIDAETGKLMHKSL